KQGFAQAFAVYIDTLLVCSATAFIIISTGMFNTYTDETYPGADTASEADTVGRGIGDLSLQVEPGPGYIQNGLDAAFPGLGPTFIAITLAFFVFTTIVAYYYMAETNLTYLTRKMSNRLLARALQRLLQALVLISVAYGAVTTAGAAWGLGDIGVGSMAWLNVIGILFLQVPALKELKEYRRQKKQGLDPQFDPRKLGIENAEFWELRADGRTLQGRSGGELEDEGIVKCSPESRSPVRPSTARKRGRTVIATVRPLRRVRRLFRPVAAPARPSWRDPSPGSRRAPRRCGPSRRPRA